MSYFEQILTVVIVFAITSFSAWCADTAGTVKTTSGHATVIRGQGTPLAIAVGQKVFAGDRIVTGPDGYAGITMDDDTRLSVGPKSELLIREFRFDANSNDGAMALSFLKGTVMVVTGLIAKYAPEKVDLRTLASTIGIRGTEFLVEVDAKD
jgi:hypothetical protein